MVAFVFTEDEIDKNNEYYMNTNNSLKYDFIEDSIKLFAVFMCRLAFNAFAFRALKSKDKRLVLYRFTNKKNICNL